MRFLILDVGVCGFRRSGRPLEPCSARCYGSPGWRGVGCKAGKALARTPRHRVGYPTYRKVRRGPSGPRRSFDIRRVKVGAVVVTEVASKRPTASSNEL